MRVGGGADIMALAPPFHMVMGVWLVGLALLRFGTRGSGGGGPLGPGPENDGKGKWTRQ